MSEMPRLTAHTAEIPTLSGETGQTPATIGTVPVASQRDAGQPRFAPDNGFYRELRQRVDAYFRESNTSPNGGPRMYIKTALIFAWFLASYILLVFFAQEWWQAAGLSLSLAFSLAGIGFAIQHDANHGSYSRRRSVNHIMGKSLDLLGASSYVWQWKHNIFHHTYTNIDGADSDIELGGAGRLSPGQKHHWFHRLQQFYLWGLYGFIAPKWQLIDDFRNMKERRIGDNEFPRGKPRVMFELLAGKAFFVFWALVLPSLFHPFWQVLLFFAATWFVVGVVLSVVFQLAHCVEEAQFPKTDAKRHVDATWAEHQLHTTVNFAEKNPFLTWYLGGLNYQVEHHLFPRVCHIHYPRLAEIVRTVAAEYQIPYRSHQRFFGAVASHWRWLKRMGRANPA
jgi:linoleoyl-CoA desaturase